MALSSLLRGADQKMVGGWTRVKLGTSMIAPEETLAVKKGLGMEG